MKKTISKDLRERIVAAYDRGEWTRQEVADRFMVSLGMVKKLLQQRRQTGNLEARHKHSGRKPRIQPIHRARMRAYLSKKPDMTLQELRKALKLECTLPAIHYILEDMGLTYKKRRSGPVNKIDRTSSANA